MCVVALLVRMVYGCYCRRHFLECRYRFLFDKALLRNMSGFAGWNFIGAASGVLRDQGGNVVINLFCGPAVNAARGIAFQVNAAVQGFVVNFMTALNPQITKSYAAADYGYTMSLVERGARFSFYILLILTLPILFETDFILSVWLKQYPGHTVSFVRLVLLLSMLDILSNTLITLQLATGNIRNYQIAVGGMLLMNFPLSYICLKVGFPPESTMIIALVVSFFCLILRALNCAQLLNL